jgi:serine/threonine protein kinase
LTSLLGLIPSIVFLSLSFFLLSGSGNLPRKFLVLELLSGGSLSHSLGLRPDTQNQVWIKKFSFLETLRFGYDLALALNYLHYEWSPSIHIIHRDIKPDNIGWTLDGGLKIFDFGLCVAVKAQKDKTEQYRLTGNTGTLRYMAPGNDDLHCHLLLLILYASFR